MGQPYSKPLPPLGSFRILSLPAELRNKIWGYALDDHEANGDRLSAVQPPITRVNRQARAETLPIYYSTNIFHLDFSTRETALAAKDWLKSLGIARQHLRELEFTRRTSEGTYRVILKLQDDSSSTETLWRLDVGPEWPCLDYYLDGAESWREWLEGYFASELFTIDGRPPEEEQWMELLLRIDWWVGGTVGGTWLQDRPVPTDE